MSEHTKEPWPEPVSDEWGGWEKSSSLSLGLLGLDDYRRARACVNACAGIETGVLEQHHIGVISAESSARMRSVEQQRDELLAALKDARESIEDWAGYTSEYFREKHKLAEELAVLDALITRMEEGK